MERGNHAATYNEGGVLMHRACARKLSPCSFFAAGEQLAANTQPALRTGLTAPAWRLLHVPRREVPDLKASSHLPHAPHRVVKVRVCTDGRRGDPTEARLEFTAGCPWPLLSFPSGWYCTALTSARGARRLGESYPSRHPLSSSSLRGVLGGKPWGQSARGMSVL